MKRGVSCLNHSSKTGVSAMNQFGGKRSGRICCLTSKVNGERKPNAHMAKSIKNYIIPSESSDDFNLPRQQWASG